MAIDSERISRRGFLRGLGAAGAGALVAGGLSGGLAGASEQSRSVRSGRVFKSPRGTPIVIGGGVPVTGSFAGTGLEMRRGMQLAVDKLNSEGGVLGRPLKLSILNTETQQPTVMRSVFQKFVSDKVAAVFAPFTTYSSVEYPIVADAKVPTFHVNTYQGNIDWVKQHGVKNIFQGDPSQIWYGPGVATLMENLISSGAWTPIAKTMAIITSNDPYSLSIAKSFEATMKNKGWGTTMFQEFTIPQSDYTAELVSIRKTPPGVIFFSDYTPGDEAAFIKQFRQAPTKSLVYEQYAPSVPQYLTLAGSAANGVLWSTVVGVLEGTPVSKAFEKEFHRTFHATPGHSNAGDQFDLVQIWARAVEQAGDPYDFTAVSAIVKTTIYRGVCGTYSWPDDYLTCYPYPTYTKFPTLGMPHLTYQIQNGKQVLISPEPFNVGKYETPPWLA